MKSTTKIKLISLMVLTASCFAFYFQIVRAAQDDVDSDYITDCNFSYNGDTISLDYKISTSQDPKPSGSYHQVSGGADTYIDGYWYIDLLTENQISAGPYEIGRFCENSDSWLVVPAGSSSFNVSGLADGNHWANFAVGFYDLTSGCGGNTYQGTPHPSNCEFNFDVDSGGGGGGGNPDENDASCEWNTALSGEPPSSMGTNDTYTARIKCTNTGDTTWEVGKHALSMRRSDVWNSDLRIDITSNVSPTGSFSFDIPITAPAYDGTWWLEYGMREYPNSSPDFGRFGNFVGKEITVTAPFGINGVCGPAASPPDYSPTATFPNGDLCSAGTATTPTPSNPPKGGSNSWQCQGAGVGTTATCTATREPDPPPKCLVSDTWIFDPSLNTWTQKYPTNSPSKYVGNVGGRGRTSMVYDNQNNQAILYGGSNEDYAHDVNAATYYKDTWVYDPLDGAEGSWSQKNPNHNPGERAESDMLWMNHTKEVLLFGGREATEAFSDTWFYDPDYPSDPTDGEWLQAEPPDSLPGIGQGANIEVISVDCNDVEIDFDEIGTDPANTTYSIKVLDVASGQTRYVQGDNSIGTNPYYTTFENWATPMTITGLSPNQDYNLSYNYAVGVDGSTDSAGSFVEQHIQNRGENIQGFDQVVDGTTAYYIWSEEDVNGFFQIWTGSVTIGDNTTFSATARTSYTDQSGTDPKIAFHNNKLYYTWNHGELMTAVYDISGDTFSSSSRGTMPAGVKPGLQVVSSESKVYHFWQDDDRYFRWGTTDLSGGSWSANSYQLPVATNFDNTIYETSAYVDNGWIYFIYQNRDEDGLGNQYNSYATIAKIETDGTNFSSADVDEYQDSGQRANYGDGYGYKVFVDSGSSSVYYLGVLDPILNRPVPIIPNQKQIWIAKTDLDLVGFTGNDFVTIADEAGHSNVDVDFTEAFFFYVSDYSIKINWTQGPTITSNDVSGFKYDGANSIISASVNSDLSGYSTTTRKSNSIPHQKMQLSPISSCEYYSFWTDDSQQFKLAYTSMCEDPAGNASGYSAVVPAYTSCTEETGGDPGCDIVAGGNTSGVWPNTGYGDVTVVCLDTQVTIPAVSGPTHYTLTIEPGVVVKAIRDPITQDKNAYILNYGTLNIGDPTGVDTRPVYFTHIYDDTTPDGDTGNDGATTQPYAGMWGNTSNAAGIYYNSTSADREGEGYMYNVIMRYTTDYAVRFREQATQGHVEPELHNVKIEYGTGAGIYAQWAEVELENIDISHMGAAALEMYGPNRTNFIFSGDNRIFDCGINGIRVLMNFYNHTMTNDATYYNDFPYYIESSGHEYVDNGYTLILEEGTILKIDAAASSDALLRIDGRLLANGTEDNPIYITSLKHDIASSNLHPDWFDDDGNCRDYYPCDTNNDGSTTTPAAGDWRYVYFRAEYGAAYGEFDYTNFMYGGGGNGANDNYGMVYVLEHNQYGETDPIFNNCIFSDSADNGLSIERSNPTVSNSQFESNTEYAIYIGDASYTASVEFLGNNTTNNNGTNGIYRGTDDHGSITFYNDMPYVLHSCHAYTPAIYNGSTLTVEKGAVLKWFTNDCGGSSADGRYMIQGTANFEGTAAEPIYVTSIYDDTVGGDTNNDGNTTSPASGDWGNFTFDCSEGLATGQIDYTEFRYGGVFDENGMISLSSHNTTGHPEPDLNNVTLRDSADSGIALRASNVLVHNLSAYDNADAVFYAPYPNDNTAARFSGVTTVENNGTNGFLYDLGTGGFGHDNNVSIDMIWEGALPIYLKNTDLIVDNGVTLTIEPGTVIKFENVNKNMTVNGTLIANGTADDPIIFTSIFDDEYGGDTNNDGNATTPSKEDWGGIQMHGANGDATGTLNHVILKYGGNGDAGVVSLIDIDDHTNNGRTAPTISNVVISDSTNHGIRLEDAYLNVTNLSIANTDLSAIQIKNPNGGTHVNFSGETTITNSGTNGIEVLCDFYGHEFDTDRTLQNEVTWYFNADCNIPAANTLTIEPGTVIKMSTAVDSNFYVYGTLNAIGTADNEIYFTSILDDSIGGDTNNDGSATTPAKEDWEGVYFWDQGANSPTGEIKYANFAYGGGNSGDGYNIHQSYMLSFRDSTDTNVEISYSDFNHTNRGLLLRDSKANIHNNNIDSASQYGITLISPPADTVIDDNYIAQFDTGIYVYSAPNALEINNNVIDTGINGVYVRSTSAGIQMRNNTVDAGTYYVRNDSSPFQTAAGGTTVDAYTNTWGAYPVSDSPAGKMHKNPGNILYDNHGVVVSSPSGGETWPPNSTHDIEWTTYNDGGNADTADIYYSVDSGTSWTLIESDLSNAGAAEFNNSHEWVVPKEASLYALIRVDIKDVADSVIASDQSGFFFITESGAALEVIMGDPRPSQQSGANNILYTNILTSSTTDGSVKIQFAPEFDFTGITAADVAATGGNIDWSASEIIDWANQTVIFPFTGQLDNTDGTIRFQLGDANKVTNPDSIGIYNVDIGVYPSADGSGEPNELRDAKVSINEGLLISANIPTFITFDMSIAAVPSGENVNGAATNFATTSASALAFGAISGGDNKIAAHDITVDTNLDNGYLLEVRYTGKLSGPTDLNDFTGTNANPATWLVPSSNAYFGYTTTDSTIPEGGDADRFTSAGGNKWAGFSESYFPVAGSTGPGTEQTRIGYRLNIAPNFSTTGLYVTEIIYIATSSY